MIPAAGATAPLLSFVIPVKNDAARLRRCLDSIRRNTESAGAEIVVVDNGSTDDSLAAARQAGAVTLAIPTGSVSALRNAGADAAHAPILAFVDADHTISSDWIAHALRLMADPSVGAAGSLCHAPQDGTWVQRAYDRLRRRTATVQPVDWLGAGNLVVRKDVFAAMGGFDVTLETCEDVDLCRKVRARGLSIVSDPALQNVHHGDPATLKALFKGELWRGRSNVAVSFRRPVQLRELPSVAVPMMQLAGLLLAAAGLVVRGPLGVGFVAAGVAPLLAVPGARAAMMTRRAHAPGAGEYGRNAVVAFVYDLARALALVAFAGHGLRRS
jgi:GT2 family glycosyltransferase